MSESEASESEHDGREHYIHLSESKLRKSVGMDSILESKKYAGKRVKRTKIFSHSSIQVSNDMSNDSNDFGGDSQSEKSDISDVSDANESDISDVSDANESDISDVSDTNESDHVAPVQKAPTYSEESATATLLQNIQPNKAQHIKQQQEMYSRLIKTRVSLQEILHLTNTLPLPLNKHLFNSADVVKMQQNAVDSLLELSGALQAVRQTMSTCTTTPEMTAQEEYETLLNHRDEILTKWHAKVFAASLKMGLKRVNLSPVEQIKNTMTDLPRLIKRTQIPRNGYKRICGDAEHFQSDSVVEDSLDIEVAGDLENELQILDRIEMERDVKRRKTTAQVISSSQVFNDDDFLNVLIKQVGVPVVKNKVKSNVDTKASKGRKLRYIVHDKLLNFMSQEPFGTWDDCKRDELFGGLCGDVGGGTVLLHQDLKLFS